MKYTSIVEDEAQRLLSCVESGFCDCGVRLFLKILLQSILLEHQMADLRATARARGADTLYTRSSGPIIFSSLSSLHVEEIHEVSVVIAHVLSDVTAKTHCAALHLVTVNIAINL